MDKLKLHTPNFTDENTAKIAALFPHCLSEGKIDFELLKQELSSSIIEGAQERYQLGWVGKREALLNANAPIAKTLRPCREESVNFDSTENLYIEGDNLDALKLLQETYLNKVKMIYIDPPYNTGNDFIYEDDFAENTADYLQRSNQKDESGNRLTANPESNGRFHSDWLSMIYPRLKLARNLLSDDGVIFISIDDNEQANLKRLCDEVFGSDNFLAEFIWKKRTGSNDSQNMVSLDHDYVLAFSKTSATFALTGEIKDSSNYKNPDNDPRGAWAKDNLTCNKTASERPNLFYPITDPKTGIEYQCNPNRVWAYETTRMQKNIEDEKVIFPSNGVGTPMYKRHLAELRSDRKPFGSIIETVINSIATKESRDLLGGQYFDYPKSVDLLKQLVNQGTLENDTILDLFSGSATTAHAVMQLNAEDGGKRKFIMIQIADPCDKKTEAFKAGYKTIADISKERIRRAGQKIKTDNPLTAMDLDIGFRVLKVDSSNMNEVYYSPDTLNREDLHQFVENIRNDRSDEDLLFQVLLDWGVDLTLPITSQIIDGKTVFIVAQDAIVACFDRAGGVSETFIKELAAIKPLRAVFCDSGFANDSVKINVEQIFKMMSPSTDIKTI
jgi:adenine-specific DNA-methyltransferase